jgi:hypothetical protein
MLMPTIPGSFAELLGAFRGCFTAPTFTHLHGLVRRLLAQPGPGTVCGMLTGARLAGIWHQPERTGSSPQRGGGPTTSGCCCAT